MQVRSICRRGRGVVQSMFSSFRLPANCVTYKYAIATCRSDILFIPKQCLTLIMHASSENSNSSVINDKAPDDDARPPSFRSGVPVNQI